MNIPREFIDLLLAKIDIVDFINQQLPLRKKSGSNYFARCPFHNEKSASFSVSQPKQFYYCFGCGAHGNAIDFVMQQDRLNFPEAVESLARHIGMEIPKTATASKKDESLHILFDLMTQVAACYYDYMRKSTRAIDYLKNRGISGSIAKQFNLGYAPGAWSTILDQFGKTDSEQKKLLDTGLTIKKTEGGYYDRFRDRIMFPIYDYRGRIIGFGGRILDQGEPKYLNSPETVLFQKGHELYGLYQALKANRKLERVLIVEGYMDVIALFQQGITYAVATLGTATTTHHIERLMRYTNDIVFCFDGDQAGRTAAWRALQVVLPLMQDDLQMRFLFLPDGEDPDSLVQKEGRDAFERRLLQATPLSDFFLTNLSQQCDMNSMEGRARFAAAALGFIKQIPASIFQGILIQALAQRARIPVNELKQQLGLPITEATPPSITTTAAEPAKTKLLTPMKLALGLLVQQPQLALLIQEPLPAFNMAGASLLRQLIDLINKNPDLTTGGLLEHWRGTPEEGLIGKLALWEHNVPQAGTQNEFFGAIQQLRTITYDQEIERLLAKGAREGLTEEEKVELTQWISKKKRLSN